MLLGGAAAATGLGGLTRHRRDEEGFRVYVTGAYAQVTSSEGDSQLVDYAWAAQHTEQMLAEGDRACDWLEDQPDPAGSGPRYEAHALAVRYLKSSDMGQRIPHGKLGQQTVVLGAWEHLQGHET